MRARGGRWGDVPERRARQLQRQVQAREERIVELEMENAGLLLKLAEHQGVAGTRRPERPPPGTRLPLLQLQRAAQKLRQDLRELRASSVELLRSCRDQQRDCLSEILAAARGAQRHLEALPSWRARALRLEQSLQEASARFHRESRRRRQLHNCLVELRGNIRVHCRIRPPLPLDDGPGHPASHRSPASGEVAHAVDEETVLLSCCRPGHPSTHKTFNFERFSFILALSFCRVSFIIKWSSSRTTPMVSVAFGGEFRVYGPAEGQGSVFADVGPLLTSLLDGYDVCVMAYGQTGSGKTYTMLGPPAPRAPQGHAGIIPRAAEELFRLISENLPESPTVKASVMEVYNNDIFDLLAKDSCPATSGVRREVLTTKEGRKEVSPLTCVPVWSAGELMELVGAGLQLRARRPTSVHGDSSRSHLIVTVTLTAAASGDNTPEPRSSPSLPREPECPSPQLPPTGRRQSPSPRASAGSPGAPPESPARHTGQVRAKLQLVDLAGSECAGVSGVRGPALRETSFINRSLAALADVLGALAEHRGHVPYRNSKLTHLLQDALGGDAKLLVIVCVSPGEQHVAETLQSLGFGARARQVERGRPARRRPR